MHKSQAGFEPPVQSHVLMKRALYTQATTAGQETKVIKVWHGSPLLVISPILIPVQKYWYQSYSDTETDLVFPKTLHLCFLAYSLAIRHHSKYQNSS